MRSFLFALPFSAPNVFVIISVKKDGDGVAVKVKFSRRSDAPAIKNGILLSLGLPDSTSFTLSGDDGIPVCVDGNLLPGEYTVKVVTHS